MKRYILEAVSLVAACTVVAGLVVLAVCQEVGSETGGEGSPLATADPRQPERST